MQTPTALSPPSAGALQAKLERCMQLQYGSPLSSKSPLPTYAHSTAPIFKLGMHHAEHLTNHVQQRTVSNCVSAATKDIVHRVQTICTRPVQLACMGSNNFTGVSQLKNNLFWACDQHTHGKKTL